MSQNKWNFAKHGQTHCQSYVKPTGFTNIAIISGGQNIRGFRGWSSDHEKATFCSTTNISPPPQITRYTVCAIFMWVYTITSCFRATWVKVNGTMYKNHCCLLLSFSHTVWWSTRHPRHRRRYSLSCGGCGGMWYTVLCPSLSSICPWAT